MEIGVPRSRATTGEPEYPPIDLDGRSQRFIRFHKAFHLAFKQASERWTCVAAVAVCYCASCLLFCTSGTRTCDRVSQHYTRETPTSFETRANSLWNKGGLTSKCVLSSKLIRIRPLLTRKASVDMHLSLLYVLRRSFIPNDPPGSTSKKSANLTRRGTSPTRLTRCTKLSSTRKHARSSKIQHRPDKKPMFGTLR